MNNKFGEIIFLFNKESDFDVNSQVNNGGSGSAGGGGGCNGGSGGSGGCGGGNAINPLQED